MMKFLLDVNASGPVGKFLITEGHDVKAVSERDVRMGDDQILQWAVNEKRVIVTTDQDFEAMVWKENRQHAGILRLENLPRSERISLLSRIVKKYENELKQAAIIIATKEKIRIRYKFN